MNKEQVLDTARKIDELRQDVGMTNEERDLAFAAAIEQEVRGSAEPVSRFYSCGCVLCICEGDSKCYGCSAKSCGKSDADCAWKQERIKALLATPQPCPKCEELEQLFVEVRDKHQAEFLRAEAAEAKLAQHEANALALEHAEALRAKCAEAAEAKRELLRKENGMQHTMLVAAEARCAKIRQETVDAVEVIFDDWELGPDAFNDKYGTADLWVAIRALGEQT